MSIFVRGQSLSFGIGDVIGYKSANNSVHVNAINEGRNWQPWSLGRRCIGNSINFSANRASERTHRAAVDGVAGGRYRCTAWRHGDRPETVIVRHWWRSHLPYCWCTGSGSSPRSGRAVQPGPTTSCTRRPRGEGQTSVSGHVIMRRQLQPKHLVNSLRLVRHFFIQKHTTRLCLHGLIIIPYLFSLCNF